MLATKYKPFRQQTKQLRANLNKSLSSAKINQLAIAFPNGNATFILTTESNTLFIVNSEGVVLLSQQFQASISNPVVVNQDLALLYDRHSNSFVEIDLKQKKIESITCEIPQIWQGLSSELFYFKDSKQLCLVEKDPNNDKLRIAYFSFAQKSIKLAHERILDGGQWSSQYNIFKVNEGGLLAWCSVSAQSLNINLYDSEDGFKVIESVENPFKTDLNILAIAKSRSNHLHLAVEGSNSTEELPIVVIQTLKSFGQVKEVRFARQETGKKEIDELTFALNIGDYIVLKVGSTQQNHEVILYSLQNESLVGQFKSAIPKPFQITNNTPDKNQFLSYQLNAEQQELNAVLSTWERTNSLSILKLLQAIQQIEQASKDHQDIILLFGAHLSGKSTFRHYLCGKELEYFKHEGGFYQVKLKHQPQDPYVEQLEKNLTISISVAEHAVIIQIPEWSHQSPIFESQIFILMQVIFQSFKKLYTIVTISEEYVEDSAKNEQVFLSVLKMIKQQEGDLSHTISIILTKIEDEDYLQMFKERIEEIMEINEQIGKMIQSINEAEKILIFENKEHTVEDGQAMLEQILGYDYLALEPALSFKVKERMQAEGILDTLQLIKHETNFYYSLANQILTYFSYLTVGCPKEFRTQSFAKEVSHIEKESGKTISSQPGKQQSSQLIIPLFNALGSCKLFIQKKEHRNAEKINEIKSLLMHLADAFQKISTKQQGNFVRIVFQSLITVLKISVQCLKVKEDEDPYQSAVQILTSNSSILGKRFIPVVNQLAELSPDVKSSALMGTLSPFMKQSTGSVVVITKTVPMSYNQQKSHYLRQSSKLLETICSLPSNVMKLDLMIEQLISAGKGGVTDQNLREVRYYLRECSRVCQFHQCHLQAIVFLLVIPDFAGISLLLDELIDHCRATRTYESKNLLQKHESELIDELITICRTCVRQNLLEKLIYLKTLNQQSSRKAGDLKNVESKLLNKQISNNACVKYLEMLENEADLPFYNLKNDSYRKVIDSRVKLIERCKQFQINEKHKLRYEKIEAINWLVQTSALPTS